ncbi:MAG: hypothetical protein ACRDDJ_18110 [[Mycobacterium] stephanolepidis]
MLQALPDEAGLNFTDLASDILTAHRGVQGGPSPAIAPPYGEAPSKSNRYPLCDQLERYSPVALSDGQRRIAPSRSTRLAAGKAAELLRGVGV